MCQDSRQAALQLLAGCISPTTPSPYETAPLASRNTVRAAELNAQAVEQLAADPNAAEALLRAALAEDLFFGPAHNNLGVLFLKRGELYAAAEEFEWAKKLMPGHPDPRVNLGLVLEKAAHTDEALAAYRAALDACPGHMASMEALARLQVESGKTDTATMELLDVIALRGESEDWRAWATAPGGDR